MAGSRDQLRFSLAKGRYIVAGVAVYDYLDEDGERHTRIDYMGQGNPPLFVGLLQTALDFERRQAAARLDVLDEGP